MSDIFSLSKEEYVREINPFKQYMEQSAFYLSKVNNISEEEATTFIKEVTSKDGAHPIVDPIVKTTTKNNVGDTEVVHQPFSIWLRDSLVEQEIISPTFTTYYPESKVKACFVDFTADNKKNRSKEKKEMFRLKMAGDKVGTVIKKNLQNNLKVDNNSISGASQLYTTPIANPNMHPSLTSTCRITSAYANANNEKLLGGNRHYYSPELAINSIASICKNSDYARIKAVINKYNLHLPSVDETMDVVLYSTRQYFSSREKEASIKEFISHLNPYERAAFVYTSDLFHLKKFNTDFIRELITKFSYKRPIIPTDNHEEILSKADEPVFLLAVQICSDEVRGIDTSTPEFKQSEPGKLVASNVKKIEGLLLEYADFFIAFFRTKNMPSAIANFKMSIRHVVLMSDTDSTIFTVEEWIEWYFGRILFTAEANAVFATLVFIATATLKHILAIMSANLGVSTEKMFLIAMKNEFKFEVFVPTTNTKHYYALIVFQEGNTYAEPDMEIKGVHLKSSNAPIYINKMAAEMMQDICARVRRNEPLHVRGYLKQIADLERRIEKHINDGGVDFYKLLTIKDEGAYTKGVMESNYKHHLFWNQVFGSTYGMMTEPPYQVFKIGLDIANKTAMKEYVNSIENDDIRNALSDWLKREDVKSDVISTMYFPVELFRDRSPPKEMINKVFIRKMVSEICHTLYYLMETLGVFRLNDDYTRLLSDEID